MDKTGWDMSSEEIADEIQREGLKENIPYYASMIEDYADKLMDAQLQALKDPKKIREIMKGSDFEHLKIEDEFGFTGEWRMSEKGVLDVIINLITNLEDK